jgi:hypothetical protein
MALVLMNVSQLHVIMNHVGNPVLTWLALQVSLPEDATSYRHSGSPHREPAGCERSNLLTSKLLPAAETLHAHDLKHFEIQVTCVLKGCTVDQACS